MKLFWAIAVKVATFVLLAVCGTKIIFDSTNWIWTVAVGIFTVVSFPVSAVLHELGHMLFGAAVKLKAQPDSENFRSFLKETFLNWWDASSCIIIPKTDKSLRGRVIFTALGGVTVNAVFVILGIVALCVPAVPTWLCALMPASFNLLALNALPCRYFGGKSDGEIVLSLIKNNDEAQVMLAVLQAQAQILKGKSILDIDEKLLFGVPQIREDDAAFISLTELRYEYFTAKGNTESAERQRARLEELKKLYL